MFRVNQIIKKFYLFVFLILIVLGVFLFFEIKLYKPGFYVFDIGQGDAILIKTLNGHNILIDGGPDNKVIYKLGEYLPYTNRQIDLIVLTHPHADHVVGLVEVLKRFNVKQIILTGVNYNLVDYKIFQELILSKNIFYQIADRPGILNLSNNSKLIILYPDHDFLNQNVDNLNNTSIVIKLINNNISILLMGDFENEEKLVCVYDLNSDILKVGHHGSITANSLDFLKAVSPKQAIISCGVDNRFNHPDFEALENIQNIESDIWRTDQNGDFYFPF